MKKQIHKEICEALEGKKKKLVLKFVQDWQYKCYCPYCGYYFGLIDDPGYYFDRMYGTQCGGCNNEFEIEDKVRKIK